MQKLCPTRPNHAKATSRMALWCRRYVPLGPVVQTLRPPGPMVQKVCPPWPSRAHHKVDTCSGSGKAAQPLDQLAQLLDRPAHHQQLPPQHLLCAHLCAHMTTHLCSIACQLGEGAHARASQPGKVGQPGEGAHARASQLGQVS
eukprot:364938-Chlamydomonas_euryale.AAC.15